MTEREELEEAFLAGYVSSRKAGFTERGVNGITERAAKREFNEWYKLNWQK